MKFTQRLIALFVAMILVVTLAATASAADGNVTYSGNAGDFVFAPGSEYSLTDLFPNFKDVMPGDVLTQRIVLKNDANKRVDVRIYMRSLGAHEDSVEFLSQLNLQVTQATTTELFDAPADQTAQLTDWYLLGSLASGGTVELDVTLTVPVTMDNTFKNMIGYLDWQFMVEETPATDIPQTGDQANLTLYIVLMIAAAAAMVVVIVVMVRKKKKDEEPESSDGK